MIYIKIVYADNAATTQIAPEVSEIMREREKYYGNPSSIHDMGQKSLDSIVSTRKQIAQSINAKPNEIIFTSGGTESNNLALKGYFDNSRGNHIITTAIEHASVLDTVRYLQGTGYDVTYLPVDNEGKINIHQLIKSIRANTILISIMFANNEIGTIQPVKEIGEIAKRYNICFHTDAVQAFGHCNIDVNELNINMLSISGHKFHAPKGVGALYVKDNIELIPILHGSGQEYGLRSGTENVYSIAGMGKAVKLLQKENASSRLFLLKNKLIDGIKTKISGVKLNGSIKDSLNNIVNFSFEGVEGEALLMALNSKGIYVSKGSACSSGHLNPSHVLTAIGVKDDLAYNSIRFSFSKYNTESDVDYILETLPNLVEKIRKEAL